MYFVDLLIEEENIQLRFNQASKVRINK